MEKNNLNQYFIRLVLWGALICLFIGFASCIKSAIPRADNLPEIQVDAFVSSSEQQISLPKLFPWDWEYLCITWDYANRKRFESALGRPLSLEEKFEWFIYGTNEESENNLIFEDSSGDLEIYPYLTVTRPYFQIKSPSTRGRCIKRSNQAVVAKEPEKSDSKQTRSLLVTFPQGE